MPQRRKARAVLEGRKTQERRVIKGVGGMSIYRAEPAEDAYEILGRWGFLHGAAVPGARDFDELVSVKAPCAVGDILYVREP